MILCQGPVQRNKRRKKIKENQLLVFESLNFDMPSFSRNLCQKFENLHPFSENINEITERNQCQNLENLRIDAKVPN